MRDKLLRNVSLAIAMFSGIVAILSIFFGETIDRLIYPLTIVASANAVILFIVVTSSKFYRTGIDEANTKASDGKLFGPMIKDDDERWGIFGKNTGGPVLQRASLIFSTGVIPIAIIGSFVGKNIVYLWVAAGFISIQLSLMAVAEAENIPTEK